MPQSTGDKAAIAAPSRYREAPICTCKKTKTMLSDVVIYSPQNSQFVPDNRPGPISGNFIFWPLMFRGYVRCRKGNVGGCCVGHWGYAWVFGSVSTIEVNHEAWCIPLNPLTTRSLKLVLIKKPMFCTKRCHVSYTIPKPKKKVLQHLKSKTLNQAPLFNHLSTIHSTKLNFPSTTQKPYTPKTSPPNVTSPRSSVQSHQPSWNKWHSKSQHRSNSKNSKCPNPKPRFVPWGIFSSKLGGKISSKDRRGDVRSDGNFRGSGIFLKKNWWE